MTLPLSYYRSMVDKRAEDVAATHRLNMIRRDLEEILVFFREEMSEHLQEELEQIIDELDQ
jgi:hypothetical protein